jgi:ABC-2 type transport system permease protein
MIAATLTLAGYSLRRIRGILIGLGLILALFQFLLTQVASYLLTRSAFDQLANLIPDFLRNIAGPSALAFLSFPGIVALGYFHPMIMTSLVGLMIAVATEPTSEVETRFVDLTLARPVTRGQVIVRTAIVLIVAGGLMLVLMSAGTSIGLACCTPIDAPPVPRGVIASLAIGLAAVMACWGGITLAIASVSKRRAVAAAIAGVSALTAYLLDYLARAWDPAAPFGVVSPFHYFDPMAVVGGQPVGIWNVGVLLAIALTGATVGYVMFSRRDI